MRLARLAVLITTVGALFAAAGCGDQQFTNDERVHFSAPKQGSKVERPVTIAWTSKDFTLTGFDGQRDRSSGQFALFLDRAPIKAGKRLSRIIKKDAACLGKEKTCLDAQALSDHYVYLTTKNELAFETLPSVASSGKTETHEVILVMVDGQGYRIGESAWHVTFRVKKRSF